MMDKSLIGKQFGRLTILDIDYVKSKSTGRKYYICQCSCKDKTIKSIRADAIGKRSNSCGCLQKEIVARYCKENYTQTNKYDLSGVYGIGYTGDGRKFKFDIEDYQMIKDYCWHINKCGYVVKRKNEITTLFHRLVMNCKDKNLVVDHINHDTTDNRKSNLRIVTQQQNCFNSKIRNINKSGCKGVSFDKSRNKWSDSIVYNGKNIHLGRFEDFNEAVKHRKIAEEKYFGEFSYDNSINKITQEE